MPRELHLYIDEMTRDLVSDATVFLAGGVSSPRPIAWTKAAWYHEILAHPHATDDKHLRAWRKGMMGPQAWGAVGHQDLPGSRLTVAGLRIDHTSKAVRKRKWDVTVLALLARVVIEAGLGPDDTLFIYTDRLGNGSAALKGRVEALAASLRWVLPADLVPSFEAAAWAKDPNHLIGVGLVDLYLLNIGRRLLEGHGPWSDLARGAIDDMELAPHADLVELPDLDDPTGLQAMLAVQTGRLHRVDWHSLLADPLPDLPRHMQEGLRRLPEARRAAAVSSALTGLAPFAEDAGRAQRAGIAMDAVLDTLRGLAPQVSATKDAHPATHRRHAYLAARAWSHAGRPAKADQYWTRWDAAVHEEPVHPALLDELLTGMNARAVFLTDLESWDAVDSLTEQQMKLVEIYLGAFERVPALGRALGARYQARILARRHLDTVHDLINQSMAQFTTPADASFGLTWGLVALGRGSSVEDPSGVVRDTLARGAAMGWGLHGLENRFLAWGLLEALSVPGVADAAGEAAAAATTFAEALVRAAGERSLTSLERLSLRAFGLWTGRDDAFDAALRGQSLAGTALRRGDMAPRLGLRTLAAWHSSTGSPAAHAALQRARTAVGSEAHLLGDAPALACVRRAILGFLSFDLNEPAAAADWVATGGY